MMQRFIVLMCAAIAALASAQVPPPSPPPSPDQRAIDAIPWPVKLGLRSQLVMHSFPLIDRVVLVPDGATYLDELSKWSGNGRWPILFDDGKFAPMFVRRFKPAQLIRRDSIGAPLPQDRQARQALFDETLTRVVKGNLEAHSARESFAKQNYAPPGIVISAPDDHAWTAALALAAARGQIIAWMNGDLFGNPDNELDQDATELLTAQVNSLVAAACQGAEGLAPLKYTALGDDVDAITLCRSIATKSQITLPGPLRPNIGGPHNDGPTAITDLLGRNPDGTRYAIVGWIFGDEARCAYMAMCSLFLPRERALMWNTYPLDNQWSQYATNGAASLYEKAGVNVQQFSGAAADVRAWQRMLPGGWAADVVVMNTKGNNDFFDLSSGTAYASDVPVLNEPVALHLTHSWSMQYPASIGTVGGRWLDHGAFVAVGSCWEPYLAAFLPPNELANRWINFVPFIPGARWWDGQSPLAKPWRVVTIGDPLMLFAPPEKVAKQRVTQPAEYGVDLGERVKALMRDAVQEKSSAKFSEAISILNLLGRDDVAVDLWRLAFSQGCADQATARAALDPLFRRRDQEEFIRAWSTAGELALRDLQTMDMLWHLFAPRLAPGNSVPAEALAALENAIRQPHPERDIERISPLLASAFGNGRALALIQREIKKTNASDSKKALADLMDRY